MSKLCQGPSCHMYDTTDRKRGPKGNKRNLTRKVGRWGYLNNDYDVRRHYYHNVCTQEQRSLTEQQYNDSTYTLNT